MIQNKIPNNTANDEKSDQNYSEWSFELNTNPTQFGDYMSNNDIEDQSDLLHFKTIDEIDEIIQECLLNDEIALCEQLTNKLENKKIATKLPNETLTNKDNLTQIFTSFNNLGKNIDLNTEIIAREKDTDAVIKTVKELVRNKNKYSKNIHYRQSKALSSYLNKFETLLLLENILCMEQTSDNPEVKEIKICVSMSLFIKTFELAHTDELAGHVGKDKTIANIKRFFFGGMYKWITQLIAGCLDCQKN